MTTTLTRSGTVLLEQLQVEPSYRDVSPEDRNRRSRPHDYGRQLDFRLTSVKGGFVDEQGHPTHFHVKGHIVDNAWFNGYATETNMDNLRQALVCNGHEAYCSNAMNADRRNVGMFIFTLKEGGDDNLTDALSY